MFGLYIHIPFCLRRCAYCDFYSQTDEALMSRYIEAVCREMTRRQHETDRQLSTLYLGGGTPSQLPVEQIGRLFSHIEQLFDLSGCEEITFEANPDDLTPAYIAALRHTPINRLSIGIQSFDDADLKLLSRRHTASQAREAVINCYSAGIRNLSIDLMYGLPHQTIPKWKHNLREALKLPISHLSAYHLTYEEGTALYRKLKKGEISEIDEELSTEMFHLLRRETQQGGMEQYEISNFCLPGYHARHNSSYWKGVPYLGVGASAHSYDGAQRSVTVANVEKYIWAIEANQLPVEREILSQTDRYNDYIITRLRTKWGIDPDQLAEQFGIGLRDYCLTQAQPHLRQELLRLHKNRLVLTPQGILRSDGIMADLIYIDQ